MNLVGGGADLDLEGAGFDDTLHPGVDQGQFLHGDYQLDLRLAAGRDEYLLEGFQLLYGGYDGADQVAEPCSKSEHCRPFDEIP